MTIGIVYQGGGGRASAGCGMRLALGEMGIHPDVAVGASGGNLNLVGDKWEGCYGLRKRWESISGFFDVFLPAAPDSDGFFVPLPLRRLIREVMSKTPMNATPSWSVYTDFFEGRSVFHELGVPGQELSDEDAVVASCSIPGIVQSVHGRYLDGGVMENTPICQAIKAGADEIFVLLCHADKPAVIDNFGTAKKVGVLQRTLELAGVKDTQSELVLPSTFGGTVHVITPPEWYKRSVMDFSPAAIEEGIKAGIEAVRTSFPG